MTDTDNEDGPRNTEAPDFETSLEQLESLVQAMEDGELSLEQSLEAFEKGIRLTRECQKALQEAEQKVQYLLGEDDTPRDDE